MGINTSNSSTLQISQSRNSIEFNVLENKLIDAKITGNVTINGKIYHSWIGRTPTTAGATLEDNATLGTGTITASGSTYLLSCPAVTLSNSKIATGTDVMLRFRCSDATYGSIWEIVAGGSSTSGVSSVQCSGNLLVVTYG